MMMMMTTRRTTVSECTPHSYAALKRPLLSAPLLCSALRVCWMAGRGGWLVSGAAGGRRGMMQAARQCRRGAVCIATRGCRNEKAGMGVQA